MIACLDEIAPSNKVIDFSGTQMVFAVVTNKLRVNSLDEWDAQRELLGPDPWENGLTPANRKNLETLIGYSKAGGLISKLSDVDDFYIDVMLDSRGRGEWAGS